MKLIIIPALLLFYMAASSQNVGIGTNTPAEKLVVAGNIAADTVKTNVLKISPNAAGGMILVSDGNGNASWTDAKTLPGFVATMGNIAGAALANMPTIVDVYQFISPQVTLTLNGKQRVFVNLVAGLGRTGAAVANFQLDVGYQLQPTGPILGASGSNYIIYISPTTGRYSYSSAVSFKPAAGTYKIGLAIMSSTLNAVNNNDWVNGFYFIINED